MILYFQRIATSSYAHEILAHVPCDGEVIPASNALLCCIRAMTTTDVGKGKQSCSSCIDIERYDTNILVRVVLDRRIRLLLVWSVELRFSS